MIDVLVAGVGTMGSMALWRLARRGVAALGLERFEPGHDRGSGHGESRMIRSAYYEGPEYVPLVASAFQLWRELERETARELLTMTGALMIGPPDCGLVAGALRSAREHGLAHEVLDAGAARRRYPQHRIADGDVVLWEGQAGVLRPERAIVAATARAEALGARILTRTAVTSIEVGDGVTVRAGAQTFQARHLVVSVGPWLAGLLPGLGLPLAVERQVMAWFTAREPAMFGPDRFPVFIRDLEGRHVYGLPSLDGRRVKVAIHHGGRVVAPDHPDRDVRADDLAPVQAAVASTLPGLEPGAVDARVCLYTNTPDEHFLVGPAPGLSCVTLLGGFSGHGFKFAPVMGDIAADLAIEGRTGRPIAGLRPDRFPAG